MSECETKEIWLPPFVYVDLPVTMTLRVDLRRRRIVECIAPEYYLGIKDAAVSLSSTLRAPKPLAERTSKILEASFDWPSCRFRDDFYYRDPDPFPDGLLPGWKAKEVLSQVLGGADISSVDLTRILRRDLARSLDLTMRSSGEQEPWGFGVLGGRGRLLVFEIIPVDSGELPDPQELVARCNDVAGRDRLFTCARWPGWSGIRPGLKTWVSSIGEAAAADGWRFYDHLELVGDRPELSSCREHTEYSDCRWGRA